MHLFRFSYIGYILGANMAHLQLTFKVQKTIDTTEMVIKPCGRTDTWSRGGVWVEARHSRSSENMCQLQGLDSITDSGSSPGLSSFLVYKSSLSVHFQGTHDHACNSLTVLSWTLLPFPNVRLGIFTSQLLAVSSVSPGHHSPTVSMFCPLSLGLFTWVHNANHLLRPEN